MQYFVYKNSNNLERAPHWNGTYKIDSIKRVIFIQWLFYRYHFTWGVLSINYLYTLDEQVIIFIKVNPINIELLSDEELELNNYYNHITKILFFYNISFYIS